MFITNRVFIFLILFILLGSCAPSKRPPAGYFYNKGVTVESLLDVIDTGEIANFMAVVKVSVYSDGIHRGTFSGRLFYKRNSGLRAILFGPFNTIIADILVADSTVEVFLPSRGVIYKMVLPVGYILPDKRDILKDRALLKKKEDALELITVSTVTDIFRVFVFDKNSLTWNALRVYSRGGKLFEMKIRNHIKGIPLDFSLIYSSLKINIKLDDLQINDRVSKELFRLPEGFRQKSLSELLNEIY
ncbi:MAG: hypothetical protein GXO99_08890 [Nitrospirae bacterium]|nr:hypothetical protein [Nitrospirota bacterium]